MDAFPDMNWSAAARMEIEKRLTFLETIREFTKDSEMTEEDALELGKLIKKGMAKRFEDEIRRRREHSNGSTNKRRSHSPTNVKTRI
ncbi:MAG: hypothetical protein ABIA93_07555 [Candidatus Woesearchaeota archaeon]